MRASARAVLVFLVALLVLTGCATGSARGGLEPREATGGSGAFLEPSVDAFQAVQQASGLDQAARHPSGAALYVEQARQLLSQLARTPVTPRNFGPQRVLCWLLREVLAGGERVEYADLLWRTARFSRLVLVCPDGYLVAALSGTPLQRLGPLQLRDGQWRVGRLLVGDFYFSRGGNAGQSPKQASTQAPGRWIYKKPTTESRQALDYQEQITGRPAWWVYMIDGVEFDGFNGKELLEAKGASYRNFLTKFGTVQPWFETSDGFTELMKQAQSQSDLARALNLPVVWHVAEVEFADFLRPLFKERSWNNITVTHTPPVP